MYPKSSPLNCSFISCIMRNAGTGSVRRVQHARTTHLQAISMDLTGTPCFHHMGSAEFMPLVNVSLLLVPCLSDGGQMGNLFLLEHTRRPCLMCPPSRMDLLGMGNQGKFELRRKEGGQREIASIALGLMGPLTVSYIPHKELHLFSIRCQLPTSNTVRKRHKKRFRYSVLQYYNTQ